MKVRYPNDSSIISTKQLWSVRNIVSSKSRTVQYRVPRCPGQYRNVQDRVPRCPSQYRDVQVPRCPGPEMSRICLTSQKLNYFGKKRGASILTLQCNSYLSHVRSFFKISSNFLSLISLYPLLKMY
jgi:hypothetical protein